MTKSGSKYFKIKVDTKTGAVKKKVDENNNEATPVSQEEFEQIKNNQGFKDVATILHAHSSPGCVYLVIGGNCWKICF